MKLLHADIGSFVIDYGDVVINKPLLVYNAIDINGDNGYAYLLRRVKEAYRDGLYKLHGNNWQQFDEKAGQFFKGDDNEANAIVKQIIAALNK